MKKHLLILAISFFSSLIPAQEAAYKVPLDSVPKDGFYRIQLEPRLTLPLSPGKKKLRIRSNGQEVPFILEKKESPEEGNSFQELTYLESKKEQGRRSLVLERPENDSIGPIVLYTEKPDSTLHLWIHGSEKQKNWKLLRKETRRSSIKDTISSEFYFGSPFRSGHEFYRFRLRRGSGGAPSIAAIGHYEEKKGGRFAYQKLSTPRIEQKEEPEKTYLDIRLDTPRTVEGMELQLEGPPFFRRTSTIGIPKGSSGRMPYPYRPIGGSILKDSLEFIEELEPTKSDRFLLMIEKGPDPPLKVEKVVLYQRKRSLVAYLEQGEPYELLLGGKLGPIPSYELARYRDSIPDEVPLLGTGAPVRIDARKGVRKGSFYWIWGSIIVAVLVLALFTYRMIRERSEKDQDPPSSLPPSSS